MIFSTILIYSCTKLHETAGGNLTSVQVTNDSSATVLLRGVYNSLEYPFTSYLQIFPLADISTDEAIVPTRANNWDDNGIWRDLHQQKWNSTSSIIHDCFNSLSGIVFAATDLLQYNPTAQQQAEARFLRAWAMYWQVDLFDQVPYREPGESVVKAARVRKGMEALDYIISEINAVEPSLPDGPASEANKYAAKTLLMKCYLNKAVYINRLNPVFVAADMDTVISLADEIINSGQYSFSRNYFDNFSPINANALIGKENIFTQQSNPDGNYLVSFAWLFPLDYAQGGFNGFCTLPDFYNKFDTADKRRGTAYSYPNSRPNPGNRVNVGFLIGQQYDLNTDDSLYSGLLPVIYTADVQNIETGSNLEMPGIRPIKYAPDYLNFYPPSPATNNFVYFRLSDVLLMKAEAISRGGIPTNAGIYGNTALALVNAIRTNPSRGVSALTSLSPNDLLDERGRELWWENWRRQDMIRFGKFLLPFQEKDYISDPKYLIFPIPDEQLAVNPNLVQNPGY
ncbi:RagB/SusD family nutrient uptake outer membrane protein [Ginsengibacter hankyongi]|uniref:RagB/SusD family nutrient uptake outer membrane protein n=2 Tax=Ginsengibacter hankyongi TaxID=2607284 RepID=A0A5J5IBL8_9BACT|nr:RagB/SusD family nutrient uptake outer membrane protein [Ginsengibacter hankyongi]